MYYNANQQDQANGNIPPLFSARSLDCFCNQFVFTIRPGPQKQNETKMKMKSLLDNKRNTIYNIKDWMYEIQYTISKQKIGTYNTKCIPYRRTTTRMRIWRTNQVLGKHSLLLNRNQNAKIAHPPGPCKTCITIESQPECED